MNEINLKIIASMGGKTLAAKLRDIASAIESGAADFHVKKMFDSDVVNMSFIAVLTDENIFDSTVSIYNYQAKNKTELRRIFLWQIPAIYIDSKGYENLFSVDEVSDWIINDSGDYSEEVIQELKQLVQVCTDLDCSYFRFVSA